MNVPRYESLRNAHEAIERLAKAPNCKQCITEKTRADLDQIATFLAAAYDDVATLTRVYLSDAFSLMDISEDNYRHSCARLHRICVEAGKRPLSHLDLTFGRQAFAYWAALKANLN